MKTAAVFFPFDDFGSAGTGRGAELLADAVREMLADNRREKIPARGGCYTPHVLLKEVSFATEQDHLNWRRRGRALAKGMQAKSKRMIWTTGNHLGVLPIYDVLANSPEDTLVIQFDAHLDIFNLTDCESTPTHGNYLMHVDGKLPKVINVGSRDLMLPARHVEKYFHEVIPAVEVACQPEAAIARLQNAARKAGRIVLDLDCDAFEPAYFPAVLHPTPFGVTPHFLLQVIEAIGARRIDIVAISEFAPDRDRLDAGLGTLLWLLEWLFLCWHEMPSTSINS
jgi:agmatinase